MSISRKQVENSNKTVSIVTMGFLSAILLAGQLGMAFLPNIEPVTPLVIIYTLVYRKQVFPIIYSFVLLEGVIFGFGIWWISYLYVWSILAIIVLLLPPDNPPIIWAITAGAFGLLFGALCAIPYLLSGGPGAAFAYWTAGIPYDILHCVGNFTLTFILFNPIIKILRKLRNAQTKN